MSKEDEGKVSPLSAFILLLFCCPWDGFVLSKLWGWFAVPLHVLPIGVWHAAGIIILFRFMRGAKTDSSPTTVTDIVWAFSYPAAALGIGALIQWVRP